MSGRVEWQAPPTNAGVDEIVATLRRDLGGTKVIAFANPKGGVHKTTATVLAAATIGGVRGRGVLAWDDNELRGTLGLRAGSARHARTIRHLVNDLDDIVSYHGDELLDRLDDYLRHASDGSYDVLAGEENPRFGRQLDPYTVRRVLELLRRTDEVICVDTGNNVESSNWQTILQMADQLVITTVPRRMPRSPPTGCSTCSTTPVSGTSPRMRSLCCPARRRTRPRCSKISRRTSPLGRGRSPSCRTTRSSRPARRSSTPSWLRRLAARGCRRRASMIEPFVR